ncbi:MAG: hypothetical protein IIU58_07245, partial [Clostridia bacterium]|nr:hypothetical protein [Clostridia bacterium]
YSATGEKAEFASKSKLENLFDGLTKGKMDGIFSLENGGTINLKLDEPQNIVTVWMYPSSMEEYTPAKADVLINGSYLIKNIAFDDVPGKAAIAGLSNLPEGTLVEDIQITLYTADGREYAALTEIVMVTK